MKKDSRTIRNLKAFVPLAAMLIALFASACANASLYESQYDIGPATLGELLMGQNRFLIHVASGGCTDKSSFKVDVKKDESAKPPHYTLTINRIDPDACKAMLFDGTLVLFDLEKDLGLKGDFTYSITNKVFSTTRVPQSDESISAIVEKYFTAELPELKEIHPEPFDNYEMDDGLFSCYIPTSWKLERDKAGDEAAGIFEIKLTKPDKAKPEDGESYFFPDPLIYVGYYSKNNNENKTYESFVKDYEIMMEKRKGSEKSHFTAPKKIEVNGSEATEIEYEVYQAVPRGPLFTTEYWLKDKFIIVNAKEGFYVIAFKCPKDFYDTYLPAFEEVSRTFKPSK